MEPRTNVSNCKIIQGMRDVEKDGATLDELEKHRAITKGETRI